MSRYEDLSGMSQWASWCCDGNDYEYVSVSDMIWILRQAEGDKRGHRDRYAQPTTAVKRTKKRLSPELRYKDGKNEYGDEL